MKDPGRPGGPIQIIPHVAFCTRGDLVIRAARRESTLPGIRREANSGRQVIREPMRPLVGDPVAT